MNSIVLTINAGSSSVKYALYEPADPPRRLFRGKIEGGSSFALRPLMNLLEERGWSRMISGIGHRVVHGGTKYRRAEPITGELLSNLKDFAAFAPDHLPAEIQLIEEFASEFRNVTQVACFDTAFHRDMPDVAKRIAIPLRYQEEGVERYGFHGLSYAYLMTELERMAGPDMARGRIILAHLGNGASLAAVKNKRAMDTTMAFTPASGIPMSTRSGDIDPGVMTYLMRQGLLDARALDEMINKKSGLLGVSGLSSDMRELLRLRPTKPRAAEAIDLFCYQCKKAIGALMAVLGGLDTLVFSGGIGEHAPAIRAQILNGMENFGVQLDESRNGRNDSHISTGKVEVRVIPTDEEFEIARAVCEILATRILR